MILLSEGGMSRSYVEPARRDTSNIWAIMFFFPFVTKKTFCLSYPLRGGVLMPYEVYGRIVVLRP